MNDTVNRRDALNVALAAATAAGAGTLATSAGAQARRAPAKPPIVLFCDLVVDPKREQEMLTHFHTKFKPAGAKFRGYIDLRMLKLRQVIQGFKLPAGVNYRFELTYESEELRQIWIASSVHKALWPGIENTLLDKNFHVALFDVV